MDQVFVFGITFLLGVVGGVVATRLATNWGRLARSLPLDVFVEDDPAVFLAGEPNWDFFEYVFPGMDLDTVGRPPSDVAREWYRWASDRGGVPANEQRIQVTLIPRDSTTVLVEALVPEVVSSSTAESGTHVACPVGGADGVVRHIEIDFRERPPSTSFRAAGEGEEVKPFKFTIGSGDAERFELHAQVSPGDSVEWRAHLHLIANGRRHIKTIDNQGRPFKLSGTDRASSYWWTGARWEE